ncbi:MAG: urease accessory protein UreD, partial [Pseudomonadota bacterium]
MSLDAAGWGAGDGGAPPQLALHAVRDPSGRSRVARSRATFPWSFARGFAGGRGADGAALAIPQTAGAGLFGGETARQRVTLAPGAALELRAAGAMVVHPGAGGGEATLLQDFDLGEGAICVQAAEPFAALPEARPAIVSRIALGEGAVFLGFEGVCAARAEGLPHSLRLELSATGASGELLLEDRQAADASLLARAAERGAGAVGTVLLIDPSGCTPRPPVGPVDLGPGVYAAAAPLRGDVGWGLRIAAADGGALRRAG